MKYFGPIDADVLANIGIDQTSIMPIHGKDDSRYKYAVLYCLVAWIDTAKESVPCGWLHLTDQGDQGGSIQPFLAPIPARMQAYDTNKSYDFWHRQRQFTTYRIDVATLKEAKCGATKMIDCTWQPLIVPRQSLPRISELEVTTSRRFVEA